MALLKFNHGLVDRLPIYSAETVGNIYITKDSHEMKVDLPDGRISISDFIIVENQAALEALGTYYENLFYYVKADNILKRCTKTVTEGQVSYTWTKINDVSELESAISALGLRVLAIENTINGYDENGEHINGIKEDIDSLETAVAGINASTVETTTSFKVTTAVGNYKIGDTIAKDDIQKIIMDMLSKDVYPTRTENASASISLTSAGAKEVGTEFTPKFSFSTKGGKYSANGVEQAANVTYNTFSVTESGRPDGAAAGTSTSSSGSFAKFTVTDDTNYKLTGSCNSTQGDIPKTYLGSDYDVDDDTIDVRIEAKEWKDLSSTAVTGYRGCFYGYYSEKKLTPTTLTSAQVRSLCTSAKSTLIGFLTYDNTNKYYYTTTNKMQQMFFAAPKDKYSTVEVANSTNGAPQTVTKITDVMVEGLNGYATAAYDVWYVDNAGAESGETKFKVTIS